MGLFTTTVSEFKAFPCFLDSLTKPEISLQFFSMIARVTQGNKMHKHYHVIFKIISENI